MVDLQISNKNETIYVSLFRFHEPKHGMKNTKQTNAIFNVAREWNGRHAQHAILRASFSNHIRKQNNTTDWFQTELVRIDSVIVYDWMCQVEINIMHGKCIWVQRRSNILTAHRCADDR